MFGTAVSSGAWGEVVSHDARFEFPDVISFADGGCEGASWRCGPWAAEGRLHRPAFVAKRDGSLRRLAVLDPAVHARYREVVGRVAGPVERSLGGSVGGGRCSAVGPRLVLEPSRRGWGGHLRRVRRLATGQGPLVGLDVRDCFGSVRPEVVAAALRRCGAARRPVLEVRRLLARFADDGIPGLPIGPEPSAVLANAVLASVDRALRSQGFEFARWCDDVVVATRNADVVEVVDAWESALGALGLRSAPEKTRLLEPGRYEPASYPSIVERRSPVTRRHVACVQRRGRGSSSDRFVRELCERAVDAVEGPDPHAARAAIARVGLLGGRGARSLLRLARSRAPYLAATVDWGLHR